MSGSFLIWTVACIESYFRALMLRLLPRLLVNSGLRRLSSCQEVLPSQGLVLDLTLGEGRHSRSLLETSACSVLGLDCDPASAAVISRLHAEFGPERFRGEVSLISAAPGVLHRAGWGPRASAVLLHPGPSQGQKEDGSRGLELRKPGPLDGRYCREDGMRLGDVLTTASQEALERMLKAYGGVVKARAVASAVVEQRFMMEDLGETEELLVVLEKAHQGVYWEEREEVVRENIDKAFLAVRRFVNDEVNEIIFGIKFAEVVLEPGGVLVCQVSTEFEENLIKRTVFREPGEVVGGNTVRQLWNTVLESKDDDETLLVFEKCINNQ